MLVQAAYVHLSTAKFIIWADWLVSDPHRRIEAAKWLAKQISGVENVLTSNFFQPIK